MLARGSIFWKVWVTIGVLLAVVFAIVVIEWRPRGLRMLGAMLLVLLAVLGWGLFNLRGANRQEEGSHVER